MVLASTIDFTLPLADPVLKFLLILLIILAAPLLLNKLRIPHLLGLIIAGAIIGPHGFNLVLRDSSIILSGTAGLLYIMFLAGLEIDMADFKRNSTKSLAFGMYTFLIPMILGTVVGIWVLRFNVLTSVLLASMFASHTLIAYPIISKLGISKNKAVSITVGGTMITDTLALLVLTIIVGMATGQVNDMFWIRLGVSILIFALIVLFGFPFIGRWFFKHVHDNISQYIFVLVMVFLGSFLAQVAGMEAIIGAFKPCAKKYGVDFTLRKDKTTQPPHYIVIFKAKDADNLEQAFREFTAKTLSKEQRPSIRKVLAATKQKVAQQPKRAKEKIKQRGLER